jgi:hypothetical protein
MTGLHARALGAAMTVALLAGCAAMRGPPPEPFAAVVIENDNPRDVTVYALRDDMRMRVGSVSSLTTRVLDLGPGMIAGDGRIQLGVVPMGSRQLYAGLPITVERGDTLHLTVGGLLR